MARLISPWLAIVLAITVGTARAQSTDKAGSRLYSIAGTVKAVSATSLTLEIADRRIVVIGADSATRVIGKGMASDLLLRKPGPRLADVIKAGDRATVSCRRSGRQLFAVEIRVVRPSAT